MNTILKQSENIVKIDEYESNNGIIILNNIYYDYTHEILYQVTGDNYKIIKPVKHHFIIWQNKSIFLSALRLDHYVIRKQCNEYLLNLKKKNPNVIIVSDSLRNCD